MSGCTAEMCANWTGQGCICEVLDIEPVCGPCAVGFHEDCEVMRDQDCCCMGDA